MNKLKLVLLLSGLLLFQKISLGQDEYDTVVVRDLETWTSAGYELKINKKLSFDISEQLRLLHNSSQLEQFFTEIGGAYKPFKGFEVGASYRFIAEKKSSGLSLQNRWSFDAGYGIDIQRLSAQFRVRYQTKSDIKSENPEDPNISHLRFRLKLDYNIKNWKFDPYVTSEFWRAVGSSSDQNFDKLRITMGTDYKLNNNKFGLFYGLERDLNKSYPKTTYLVGLSYQFKHKLKTTKQDEK